jgi:hypothetical protein
MPNEQRPASTRSAIELMTAWLDSPNGPPDLLVECLISHLDGRSPRDNLSQAIDLIMGLTYLSGSLLVLLEDETGIPARNTVRHLALQYAQD